MFNDFSIQIQSDEMYEVLIEMWKREVENEEN